MIEIVNGPYYKDLLVALRFFPDLNLSFTLELKGLKAKISPSIKSISNTEEEGIILLELSFLDDGYNYGFVDYFPKQAYKKEKNSKFLTIMATYFVKERKGKILF